MNYEAELKEKSFIRIDDTGVTPVINLSDALAICKSAIEEAERGGGKRV